jgi:hypothetical protein
MVDRPLTDHFKRKKCSWIVSIACLFMVTGFVPVQAQEKPMAATQADVKPAVSAPAPAPAEEEKPTADLTVSALNMYYNQGTVLTRNSLVVQPSIAVGYKGFSATLWGNLDTNPYPLNSPGMKSASHWTETDATLAYSKTVGIVNMGVSYAYTGNAGDANDASVSHDQHDLGVKLGLNTLLNPTLNVFYMIDNSQRWYFMFGISHTFEFNKMLSLKLAASAAYLASDVNPEEMEGTRNKIDGQGNVSAQKYNAFLDGVASVAMPVKVTKDITVTPSVAFAFPLCTDAENYMKYNSHTDASMSFSDKPGTFIIYGVTASFCF